MKNPNCILLFPCLNGAGKAPKTRNGPSSNLSNERHYANQLALPDDTATAILDVQNVSRTPQKNTAAPHTLLLIWILLPLLSLATTTVAQSTGVTFAQATAQITTAAGNSESLSFPSNTTAGDVILVAVDFDASATPSISDSQGNSFTAIGGPLVTPGGAYSRVFYAKNIAGGTDTVTATLSGRADWIELYLTEYSGADPTNPIDAQAGATGTAGAVSSGSATTTSSGDVIFGYCVADWAASVGSGFTARSTLDSNLIEDEQAGSAGAYAATASSNQGWSMQMVALKPGSSAVGGAPAITSATSANAQIGSAFSYQITATNSPTSFGAAGLPAGLSIDTVNGLISGKPTASGNFNVSLSATNSGGTGTATMALNVAAAAPVITSATTASGTTGSTFAYQITATNAPSSYAATGLPEGLEVNTATGAISGTPTATGTSSVTLNATNAGGTGTATLTLTINSPAPVVTSATSASASVGSAFSYQITGTNAPTSYAASGLPAGLTVNSSTGLISGAPTQTGTSAVTLSATNAGGTGTATLTLTITSTPYFVQAVAKESSGSGTTLSISFPANTLAGDVILVGFDFNKSTTPSLSDSEGNVFTQIGNQLVTPGGAYSRVYYAKNITGGADTVTVNLTAPADWIEMYLSEYAGADPNNPIDTQSGNTGPAGLVTSGNATTTATGDVIYGYCVADWSASAGSGFTARSTLDQNLVEDELAGAPGAYAATGTASNGWSMQMVALRPASGTGVGAPAITSATTASGIAGQAFSYQIAATNSPASYTAAGLPSGLSVNNGNGLISGTPTAAGTSTVTLGATNSAGTGSATLTLTISSAVPVLTSATSANGAVGVAFSYQITATNSPTSYGATGLPAGLNVNTTSGLISGTPSAAGTSTVTVSATNAGGTGSEAVTITIGAAQLQISRSSVAFNSVSVGSNATQTVTLTNSGNATLNISAASISGSGYSMSLKPTSINAGAKATFTVTFAPTTVGSATGSISIASNAPNSPATIALSGAGIQAQIAASPSSVAFGAVTQGDTDSQQITLTNNGNATLTFSQISVSGAGFNQTGLSTSTTIGAGSSGTFNVTFDPSSAGAANGSVTLNTNGNPASLVISLSGTGQAAALTLGANPGNLSFGNVNDGGSSSQTTLLTNSGTANVTISAITVTGAGFSASGVPNGTVLTAGQSATLTVTFAPTSAGAVSGANISIASNATNSPTAIGLSGTGTHTVALSWGASSTSGVTYNVYRGTSPGGEGTSPINTSAISETTFTDTNVTSGQEYYYVVEAVDSDGNSEPSNEAAVSIPTP